MAVLQLYFPQTTFFPVLSSGPLLSKTLLLIIPLSSSPYVIPRLSLPNLLSCSLHLLLSSSSLWRGPVVLQTAPFPILEISLFLFSWHNMINHSINWSTVAGLLRGAYDTTSSILLRDTQSWDHLLKLSSKVYLTLSTTHLKQLSSNVGLAVCH